MRRSSACRLLGGLLCGLSSVRALCDLTGTWQSVGSSDPITVVQTGAGFLATAARGFTDAPGTVYTNGSVYLNCCAAGGIWGTVDAACARIAWADGVGSQWARPVAKNVTISNVLPRLDDTGAILRVQDGCLLQDPPSGKFYLYGARYQCCPIEEQAGCYNPCGWRNTTFAVYSSPDLLTWHEESASIFPIITDISSPRSNQENAYFEPCAMYSAAAGHYALWFLSTNTKGVAVSDSPTGPFESVSWDVGLPQGSDSYFWTDTTDPARPTYIKHNGPPPPGEVRGAHYVSRLAPDLLSVLPNATSAAMMVPALPVPPYYQGSWPSCSEGGGVFSAGGRWFVMAGPCCCFCQAGSSAYVWSADAPLGPYTLVAGAGQNVIAWNASSGHYATRAQQFGVAAVPTAAGGIVPVYVGQRFGSADDGVKCHDYQFWAPLSVGANGTVSEVAWIDEFTLDVLTYSAS